VNAIHHTKDLSAANAIAAGTTATLLFGPVPVDHLNNFALHFTNSGSEVLYLSIKTSYDEGRSVEDDFPLGSFTNSACVAVRSGSTLVRSLYGDSNPFRYITVLGSATAALTAASMNLKISGRSNK
jgi:hypothetical protein